MDTPETPERPKVVAISTNRTNSSRDVAEQLRFLADAVEDGHHNNVHHAVVILETDIDVRVRLAGDDLRVAYIVGLLEMGKHAVLEGELK